LLLTMPFTSPFTTSDGSNDAIAQPAALPFSASLGTPIPTPGGTLRGTNMLSLPTASAVELDPSPQQVQGVFRTYRWQAYAGYTFFRFYETSHPTRNENQNGANWSIVYYWKEWLGIDGEMSATYGTQNGQDSWFLFGRRRSAISMVWPSRTGTLGPRAFRRNTFHAANCIWTAGSVCLRSWWRSRHRRPLQEVGDTGERRYDWIALLFHLPVQP